MSLPQVRDLFAQIDPPIWLLTAAQAGQTGGLIATFVVSASIVPEMPRVLVGLAKQHHTCQLVHASAVFSLSLLATDQIELVWRFGMQSGRTTEKFGNLPHTLDKNGCPVVPGVVGEFACKVEATLDTGDRTVFLGQIEACEFDATKAPLRLSQVIRSADKTQRNTLREQMARDAAIDAAAIETWRKSRLVTLLGSFTNEA